MTDDRIITIPPDHVVHEDIVFTSDEVPDIWSIPSEVFQPIWDMGITGKGVRVAVDDTGAARHHHLPTPVASRNFTSGSPSDVTDRNGHGTHCAGTVLGREGVGVAPEADLIVCKVLGDNGSGSTRGINEARIWAAGEGADILSESLGGPGGSQSDIDSINRATENGVQLDVAAAGNSGYRGSNTIGYPGRYLETFCIGSYRIDGRISSFSSGGRQLDCATPGEQIISCSHRGGFVAMSGTSMATPHFAGLMALVIQKRRMTGRGDIYGADAWRDFFTEEGMFSDGGETGRDDRFGLGRPVISAILQWLKDPEWV